MRFPTVAEAAARVEPRIPYEWPYCAKCKRGVEKVERRLDLYSGAVLYMVYCHGQKETQVVNGLDLHDATLLSQS